MDTPLLPTKEAVIEALKQVKDPELDFDIYTLGLIYDVQIGAEGIDVLMTLTSGCCPFGDVIVQSVEAALEQFGLEVRVDITFEPEWQPPEALRAMLGL